MIIPLGDKRLKLQLKSDLGGGNHTYLMMNCRLNQTSLCQSTLYRLNCYFDSYRLIIIF
jgi:hypothetical protein